MTESTGSQNKCLACDLDCELKEKQGNITFNDLEKAPENCPCVIEMVNAISEPMRRVSETMSKTLAEAATSIKPWTQVSPRISQIAEHYMKQQEAIARSLSSLILPQLTFNQLEPALREMAEMSRYLSRIPQTYYLPRDLEKVQATRIPLQEERSISLTERLSHCRKGNRYWHEFQTLCKDILMYLFVPPLVEPTEESATETGLQRRDVIFPIPSDIGGLWNMIGYKHYAEALIVECKNHSEPIGANEIAITSKYLGKKRLGMFSLVISRHPPSDSAKKEIKRLWLEEDKLVMCLDDEDLKTMIQLKENGEDPALLIDKKRFEFLQSLE